MAECFACGREMNEVDGCDSDRTIVIGGTEYDPVPYGDEWDASGRCHDCGAKVGENHHPGCDVERCPECGGQYFICDCDTEEKRELWSGS